MNEKQVSISNNRLVSVNMAT